MKLAISIIVLVAGIFLTGCMSGKYSTYTENTGYQSEGPLKLNMFGKAQYTRYYTTTSTSFSYYEDTKYKKKGDTLYMKPLVIYGDTAMMQDEYYPMYLVKGDTLESLDWNLLYVKQ